MIERTVAIRDVLLAGAAGVEVLPPAPEGKRYVFLGYGLSFIMADPWPCLCGEPACGPTLDVGILPLT